MTKAVSRRGGRVGYAILEVLLDIRGELSEARDERVREREREAMDDRP